jgi:hypothetical protein
VHGVERWRADCGCNSGGARGWHQAWRGPLREAFDRLRDALAEPYEHFMAAYTDDPWAMRDDYIAVVLDRGDDSRAAFFKKWMTKAKDYAEQDLLKALEVQRNLLLIYTSCAWFFDEVSGIETEKTIEYAARAIELAGDVFGIDLEDEFMEMLAHAPSNIPDIADGKGVYERYASPARVGFLKIAAHIAAGMLLGNQDECSSTYCYDYTLKNTRYKFLGKAQCICGAATIVSRVTREEMKVEFCLLHWGDHNLNIGVSPFSGDTGFAAMAQDFESVFIEGDMARSVRLLDQYFGSHIFTLRDLLHGFQKRIVNMLYRQALLSVEDQFFDLYNHYSPVMTYISHLHLPQPEVFSQISRFVQTQGIRNELEKPDFNIHAIQRYLGEAKDWGIELGDRSVEPFYLTALHQQFALLEADPGDPEALAAFGKLTGLLPLFPFQPDTSWIQGAFFLWARQNANKADAAGTWRPQVDRIAGHLKIRPFAR